MNNFTAFASWQPTDTKSGADLRESLTEHLGGESTSAWLAMCQFDADGDRLRLTAHPRAIVWLEFFHRKELAAWAKSEGFSGVSVDPPAMSRHARAATP